MVKLLNTEKFIEKARSLHGEKYDYSKVNYTNNRSDIEITCNDCGLEITTKPINHYRWAKCFCEVANRALVTEDTWESMAREVHGDRYDYSKVVFTQAKDEVEIVCKEHGSFWQPITKHIRVSNHCPKCARALVASKMSKSIEQFRAEATEFHKGLYIYDDAEYITVSTKLKIFCTTCQSHFMQTPNSHLRGKGCPRCCVAWISKAETAVAAMLDAEQIEYEREWRHPECRDKLPLPFDFKIGNVLIEIDGRQHSERVNHFHDACTLEERQRKDAIKDQWAEKNGYELHRVRYLRTHTSPRVVRDIRKILNL